MDSQVELPNEMIDHIISFLDSVKDRHALLDLCLASKACYIAAQPNLFSKFSFTGHRLESSNQSYVWYGSAPREQLLLFTRTLMMRPDLAQHVKDLDIEVFEGDNNEEEADWYCSTSESDMDMFTSMVTATGSYSMTWIKELQHMNVNAFISLLVVQAPNVERLSLILDYKPFHMLSVLATSARDPSLVPDLPFKPLTTLKELDLSHMDVAGGYTLEEIAPLLWIPTLEKVYLSQTIGHNVGNFPPAVPPRLLSRDHFKNFSHLDIQNSAIDSDGFADLLASCRNLKHLEYRLGYKAEIDASYGMPENIMHALGNNAASLIDLHFDYSELDSGEIEEVHDSQAFGASLERLGCLKTLSLSQQILPEATTLPRNIESLTVMNCDGDITAYLASLASLKRTQRLHLQCVEVKSINYYINVVFGLSIGNKDRSIFDRAIENNKAILAEEDIKLEVKLDEMKLRWVFASNQFGLWD
jgi:hypothetical protein